VNTLNLLLSKIRIPNRYANTSDQNAPNVLFPSSNLRMKLQHRPVVEQEIATERGSLVH